ncbi:MAG: hypothetical protein ACRCUY_04425 [Thermoguttaceae bacterium]
MFVFGYFILWRKPYSATSSLESYSNWARKESYCLFNNGRMANFTLQLNLLRFYIFPDIPQLRQELTKLFAYLSRKKTIVAYAVLEVTKLIRQPVGWKVNQSNGRFNVFEWDENTPAHWEASFSKLDDAKRFIEICKRRVLQ